MKFKEIFSKYKKIIFIASTVVIVTIIAAVITINVMNSKKMDNKSIEDILTSSDSFFIRNSDGNYAIFNVEGKQISDFIYRNPEKFLAGAAKVKNQDNKSGVVASNGKMVIDFGVCQALDQVGPFYECKEDKGLSSLINSNGKVLYKGEDYDFIGFVGEKSFALFENEKDNKYSFIDYKGKVLETFPKIEDAKSPLASSTDDYVTLHYNNKLYVYDLTASKKVMEFDSETPYCVKSINENDPGYFILGTCTEFLSKLDVFAVKVVKDGKVLYSKDYEKSSDVYFKGDSIEINDGYKYVLDDNGEKGVLLNNVEYTDYKNYVKETDGILAGSDLYVNGNLKEHLDCNTVQGGYQKYGIYLLDNCTGNGNTDKRYIRTDGSKLSDKWYYRAYAFDKNGFAPVSEDGEKFYLINTKGEKVSGDYDRNNSAEKIGYVDGTDNLYRGSKNNKSVVFEPNGKELISGERIDTQKYNDKVYATVQNDRKYTLYDLTSKKEIITLDTKMGTDLQYFTTHKDNKTQYYSYVTGKMFYEA